MITRFVSIQTPKMRMLQKFGGPGAIGRLRKRVLIRGSAQSDCAELIQRENRG
jgi:hypothetical protein